MDFKKIFLTAVLGISIITITQAQVQLSASGSYLKGTDKNKASLWGGGVGGKFFLGNNVALGADLNIYPKQTNKITGGSGANSWAYTSADLVSNVTAGIDVLLTPRTSVVQPYLGADAGLSFNNQTVTYSSNTTQSAENKNNKTFFLLAPKAGVNIGLGQAFGIFAQAKYNFTFGDGNPKNISFDNVPNPVSTEPVSKYFTFNAGIYVRLTGAGK